MSATEKALLINGDAKIQGFFVIFFTINYTIQNPRRLESSTADPENWVQDVGVSFIRWYTPIFSWFRNCLLLWNLHFNIFIFPKIIPYPRFKGKNQIDTPLRCYRRHYWSKVLFDWVVSFLSAIRKIANRPLVSSCLSVCLSAWDKSVPTGRISWNSKFEYLSTISSKNSSFVKIW